MEVKTGSHIMRTIFSPAALISLIVFGGAAYAAGAIGADDPKIGLAAAGAVFVLWLLIVLTVGMRSARQDFYAAYAQERKLEWTDDKPVPPSTPLLRRGDSRRLDEAFSGDLPGGLEGILALYTYEETSAAGQGTQAKELHHFTIVLALMPDLSERLPALYVQRRSGFQFLDGAEDVFRSTKRVELESIELDRKCEIFADPACDENWIRQLFEPSFVDFLAEQTPKGFAFEVQNGVLCVNVNRHRGKAAELDEISKAAGAVAKRIRDEASE